MVTFDKIRYYASRLLIGTALKPNCAYSLLQYSTESELVMKCKNFSEVNETLEHALYVLNKKGFPTYACCKGHWHKEKGYIAFKVEKSQEDFINHLCSRLLEETDATVYIHYYRAAFSAPSLGIYFSSRSREKVLHLLLNSFQDEHFYKNPVISELFSLCHLEASLHSDLMFGAAICNKKGKYYVETGHNFMFFSTKSFISISQLQQVCDCLDTLREKVNKQIVSKEDTLSYFQQFNLRLQEIADDEALAHQRDYDSYTDKEIAMMMQQYNGFVPGQVSDIIDKYRLDCFNKEEGEMLQYLFSHENEYIELLKMEETLSERRMVEKPTLQY